MQGHSDGWWQSGLFLLPLISFKLRSKPRFPRDRSRSSKYCPAAGRRWRGLGARGVGSALSAGSQLKTGFPPRDACCPPKPPLHRVALEGRKQSLPGVASPAFPPPHRLPVRVDSELGSGNQSDHFAHFPSLPGRRAADSQGGVSPAQPRPRLPCGEWICPEGSRQRDTPVRVLRAAGRLPTPSPRILKAGGWTLHSWRRRRGTELTPALALCASRETPAALGVLPVELGH